MSSHTSAKITLWCNRFIALVVFALIFAMPTLIEWYDEFRTLQPGRPLAILICFYCCVPAVLIALWCIDKLLVNILDGMVFTHKNVSYIRRIRWCCAAISLVCFPGAYMYPPLIFLAVIMGFLALVVSVAKNVLAAAVEIREENDLTI